MKKILTILGAVTLTASTGLSVIACGTNREEGKVPPISQELIKEYQNELTKIWNSVYNENADKFIRKIGESGDQENYHLFNLNYLDSKYEHISGSQKFDLHKDQVNAEMFQKDLNLLFPKNQFESKIQSNIATGRDAIKYRNLYMGSPTATLGEFHIAEDKPFQVIKTAYKENEVQERLYSIVATVSKNMFYKDAQGQTELFRVTEVPLNIVIGKDGIAITLIENIATNLPKNLFTEQGTQFATSTIKQTNSKFKTYDDDLELNLANHVNSDDFKNIITAEIDKLNNNQEEIELTYGSKISEEGEINLISTMLRNSNQQEIQTKELFDLQRNPLSNSLILKKAETEFLGQNDAVMMLEEIVKDLDNNIETHETELNTFLDLYFSKNEPKDNLIKQTHSFGNLRLNKIHLEIKEQELSLELPTMIIPWTYRNNFANNLNKKELWLISVYNALKIVNQKVMSTNSTYYDYEVSQNYFLNSMFNISDSARSNVINSFKITWEEILKRTEEHRINWYVESLEYARGTQKFFKINNDTEEGTTWVELVRANETYITNEEEFDFSSFTAKVEAVTWMKTVNNRRSTVTFNSIGNWYTPAPINRNQATYGLRYNYMNPGMPDYTHVSYIFNIGKIKFNLFLPLDYGKQFSAFSNDKDNYWNGNRYFGLSNDRNLFTRIKDNFSWDIADLNPYINRNPSGEDGIWFQRENAMLFSLK